MSTRAVTEQQERDIARFFREGVSIVRLAYTYGCSESSIRTALARQRNPSMAKERTRQFTPEETAELATRWRGGEKPRAMAEALGISHERIRNILREAGCDIATRNRPSGPKGTESTSWRGGRSMRADGYIYIRLEDDDYLRPMGDKGGYVREHRLIFGRALGRVLSPGDRIIHIDGNRENNTLSNLILQDKRGVRYMMTCADCGSHDTETIG